MDIGADDNAKICHAAQMHTRDRAWATPNDSSAIATARARGAWVSVPSLSA